MKRSKANDIIQYAIDVMKKAGYPLPPFAYYEKADWEKLGEDEIELVENMLGWDITDFGTETSGQKINTRSRMQRNICW